MKKQFLIIFCILLLLATISYSSGLWDIPNLFVKAGNFLYPRGNESLNVTRGGSNISATNYLNASGHLEWIKPENVFDIDDEDIESDLNTYVDIAGDNMTSNLGLEGNNLTNVSNIIGSGDNVIIGDAGVDSNSLTADDDLFVSGKLEIDGLIYFDGISTISSSLGFLDNVEIKWGTGGDAYLDWSTSQISSHTLVWGLGSQSNSIIFTNRVNRIRNFFHTNQTDPTIFIHSSTDPTTDNSRYLSIAYKGNETANISVGNGSIHLGPVEGNVTISSGSNLILERGNITAENVWFPVMLFAHTNATIAITTEGTWYNITFNEEESTPKKRITHTHSDATNDTFTIVDTGTYHLGWSVAFADTAPNPSDVVATRIIKNGAEIPGSVFEKDTTKQNAHGTMHHQILVDLTAADEIKVQFTSNATTVSLETLGVYGTHPDSATVQIHRIA